MDEWRRMEAEHTKNRAAQEKIVRKHIAEHGIQYYTRLKVMEKGLKKG
jgi:hypothetical protein